MKEKEKKRFFLSYKKSSALVVSVIIHVVFLLIAATFVAVSVIIKDDPDFKVQSVKRPKMNLRKLQVPVEARKKDPPKLRKTIVVNTPKPTVDIKMPEIIGVKGGLGSGSGGGFSLGFDFDMDLFGGNSRAGNDFIGTFYDLKQHKDGSPSEIGQLVAERNQPGAEIKCHEVIRRFLSSGWKETRLKDYFSAPKQKFARFFNIPPMPAERAPQAFDVADQVKPGYWICVYRGQIMAPETGKYRFWGIGDDLMVVKVGNKLVLNASWPETYGKLTNWRSDDDDSMRFLMNQKQYGTFKEGKFQEYYKEYRRMVEDGASAGVALKNIRIDDKSLMDFGSYMSGGSRLIIGDWIPLRAGQQVEMEVLIGEIPGKDFSARLLVEQQGQQYRKVSSDAGARPVLPMFKTAPVPDQLVNQMEADPNEMTLNGPTFGVEKNGM